MTHTPHAPGPTGFADLGLDPSLDTIPAHTSPACVACGAPLASAGLDPRKGRTYTHPKPAMHAGAPCTLAPYPRHEPRHVHVTHDSHDPATRALVALYADPSTGTVMPERWDPTTNHGITWLTPSNPSLHRALARPEPVAHTFTTDAAHLMPTATGPAPHRFLVTHGTPTADDHAGATRVGAATILDLAGPGAVFLAWLIEHAAATTSATAPQARP